LNRRRATDPAGAAAPGSAISPDHHSTERRQLLRRRGDARSVAEMLDRTPSAAVVKTFLLGGSHARRSALYDCGCLIVDPATPDGALQVLECPTHAGLQAKLRRRQTDRH
jgi:hypothetical protein